MELKISISRSYAEKLFRGQYDPIDFFSSRSQEFDNTMYSAEELRDFSDQIHFECVMDVKRAIEAKKEELGIKTDFNVDKVQKTIDNMFRKIPMDIAEFQDWTDKEKEFLNVCKKGYKRIMAEVTRMEKNDNN